MDLPLVVIVPVPGVTDAGAIDTEVYCVNTTDRTFEVSSRSASFTTVDDEAGTVVEHGSRPETLTLLPGQAKRIGDVAGWEWDGYVGMELVFREDGKTAGVSASYSLKHSKGSFTLETEGKSGRVVPPGALRRI